MGVKEGVAAGMSLSTVIKPNIVVLDGFALNPGDLSWKRLADLGRLTVYDRTPADRIVERAKEADVVLTNKTPLSAETLAHLPRLKFVGVLATGYDVVDVRAAAARGVPVANVPDYGTASVAQATFALLLELVNRVGLHDAAVRSGEWTRGPDWCLMKAPLVELEGKTMGIVGFGRIGRRVAAIAEAFGMRVIAAARESSRPAVRSGSEDRGIDGGQEAIGRSGTDIGPCVLRVPLDELLAESDVVSLHCPLTSETRGLIDADRLERMKPTAYLINTARGALVNERDLAAALHEGRIAGAGLDVLSVEPPGPDHPLLNAPRCVVTPHVAWATREARRRLMDAAAANVEAFLAGRPTNVVNAALISREIDGVCG